jgi:hypothetical protein
LALREEFERSSELLRRVRREFETLQRLLQEQLGAATLGKEKRNRAEELLSGSELTYLLRLFSAFESGLVMIGPHLSVPCTFGGKSTLHTKVNQIGSAMNLDSAFRSTVDDQLTELRNELMHGRSLVPRISFDAVWELMRDFRRGCH